MKLDVICEGREVFLVSKALNDGVINEGFLSMLDGAVETVFGAAGFIPGLGDVGADLPMVIKNLVQGDYLGAALFAISMSPEPVSDVIAKSLRVIQKLAAVTGNEERLNRSISWLMKKHPMVGEKSIKMFSDFSNKIKDLVGFEGDKKGEKNKESSGIIRKAAEYIGESIDKMLTALKQFIGLINKKAKKLDVSAGFDAPDEFIKDLAEEIERTYHEFRDTFGIDHALRYRSKVNKNRKNKPEIDKAYLIVFGDSPAI